ncbi:MAG: TonB-dependent receptor [Tannerella sp.]|jgi:hypothetical protein|nr:TonB-dependent receptor [Tannerella sp.]
MKNIHATIKVLTIAAIWGVCAAVGTIKAQEQLEREMTLEREYDPTVRDANKINRLPEIKEPVVSKRPIDYSPFTSPAYPSGEIAALSPGNIHTEILHNKRRGYFHFGGGMYANLSGDLGYHLIDGEQGKLALFVTHNSTAGNVKFPEYDNLRRKAKLNDNLVAADFNHSIGRNAALRIGASYGYTGFNYYGIPFTTVFSSVPVENDTETGQINQTVDFNLGISGDNGKFGYTLGADFRHFNQKYGWRKDLDGIREDRLAPKFDMNFSVGDAGQRIGIAGAADFFNYRYPSVYNIDDLTGYRSHVEATVSPYFITGGETWHLRLGANVMLISGDSLRVFASPNVSVEAQVADRTVFYADARGEIRSNDAYSLSRLNRYTDHSVAVKPSRTWLDARLGIRSGIAEGFRTDIFAGFRSTKDAAFFIPTYRAYENADFASYAAALQADASLMCAGAVFMYAFRTLVDISLKGVYNRWTVDDDGHSYTPYADGNDGMKPYGLPEAELNADVTVKPLAPLALTLDYYLGTGRYTLLLGREVRMKDLHELNFRASWNFNDNFGAYLKLNNLMFRSQERMYGYPMQGFHAMAGININF